MTTAVEYRQYAEECLTAMRAAVIPEVRAALFVAAQRWTALAEQIEADEADEIRLRVVVEQVALRDTILVKRQSP
jgi:hypothetical protein